jgi:hypothetical protein
MPGACTCQPDPTETDGIEPLEPGFRKIRIKPQPDLLKSAEIKHPTIRGDVTASFINDRVNRSGLKSIFRPTLLRKYTFLSIPEADRTHQWPTGKI